MKNGSKKGAKIKPKSIKKRGPKIDAKMEPKRVQPPTPGRPPRRFPSKKGTCRKTTNKQKNNNDCRKLEVQCRKSEQSTNRIPTRLGRLRPGADFRGPWPPGGGPKYARASKERRGAAERKKNQERKSQESGKRYNVI